jgi:hypothetical protein
MRWLVLAVLVSLAGCLEESGQVVSDDADQARASRPGQGAADQGHFDLEFPLTVYGDEVPNGIVCIAATCFNPSDCVFFAHIGEGRLTNGTALLTWTPSSPLAETFVLVAAGSQSDSATGPSPLALPFDLLEPTEFGEIGFTVETDLPSFPLDQDVILRLTFDYEGGLPTSQIGNCQWI